MTISGITPIFVDDDLNGLHTFVYGGGNDDDSINEFEKLFDDWNDTEYVGKYLITNKEYLTSDFFNGKSIDALISQVREEAQKLENLVYEYAISNQEHVYQNLQMLFKPLNDLDCSTPVLQSTKAIVPKGVLKEPLLRLYAIRVEENCFIITGGAIKLTHKMEHHTDTQRELMKINQCKEFLKENNVSVKDDLIYYYEGE